MNPLMIIVPVAALVFGPRLWVGHVLKQHNRKEEDGLKTGGELARELLDRHQLHNVSVESTDLGDHYDPDAKAVRLTRDKIDRRTLAAVTTAAHEVAHAIQDASEYGPFVLRTRLASVAQVTGQVGSGVLMAVPIASLASRQPIPPMIMGTAILAMLGTGVAVQVAALPTELDASFRRALPILREDYINAAQANDAKIILLASSLTYVASSLLAVLHVWPWLGRPPASAAPTSVRNLALVHSSKSEPDIRTRQRRQRVKRQRSRLGGGTVEGFIRLVGKPLIRSWFQIARAL